MHRDGDGDGDGGRRARVVVIDNTTRLALQVDATMMPCGRGQSVADEAKTMGQPPRAPRQSLAARACSEQRLVMRVGAPAPAGTAHEFVRRSCVAVRS